MTQSHSTLAAALMGRLYYHLTPFLSEERDAREAK